MEYLIPLLFYGIPAAAIVFWIVSLILYCGAKRRPGNARRLKGRKRMLTVASVVAGGLTAVVLILTVQISMAIANM